MTAARRDDRRAERAVGHRRIVGDGRDADGVRGRRCRARSGSAPRQPMDSRNRRGPRAARRTPMRTASSAPATSMLPCAISQRRKFSNTPLTVSVLNSIRPQKVIQSTFHARPWRHRRGTRGCHPPKRHVPHAHSAQCEREEGHRAASPKPRRPAEHRQHHQQAIPRVSAPRTSTWISVRVVERIQRLGKHEFSHRRAAGDFRVRGCWGRKPIVRF